MHDRLLPFAAKLVRDNGGVATRKTMKSVENFHRFLDELRSWQR